MRDEKLHAVVARSTFAREKAKNTPGSDHCFLLRCRKSARRCGAKHICKSKCTKHLGLEHFWKLGCRKSARRCGAKHISKSKCTKHPSVGPLLEAAMSKKCTPLLARGTFPSQNVQNTPCLDHFWKLRCRKSACRCGAKHVSKSKCENTTCSRHFWTLRWRFAWQAQGIVHVVKSEQNVRVLWHFQKRWQAQYKRHMSQTC